MFITIIIEDERYQPPDQDDLQTWADRYGLTMPVLADPNYQALMEYAQGSIGLPYTVLLDEGAVLVEKATATTRDLDALL